MKRFYNLPPRAVRLEGPMGKALRLTVENRLKKVNYAHLVDPFRRRRERDGLWRCEFWGKIVRSAIHAWRATGDRELLSMIRNTVDDLLSTQTPDGCISSYPEEKQTSGWDIWGRKYVLLALIRYYEEIDPDSRVKQACTDLLDHLMRQIPSGEKMKECGEHQGLAASSILDAVVGVYRIAGEARHLEYARGIAGSGCSLKHNIFRAAAAGVPPAEIGNGKAYELTSCFQGLAELYRADPHPEYLAAAIRYRELVRDYEIFITGAGGLKDLGGEYWHYGKWGQTRHDPGVMLGETCITTTWIRYNDLILRLTGDCGAAGELERVFYNAALGEMTPDADSWMHANPTPLAGSSFKRPADDQITGFGEDCCLAQGPEAIAMAPLSAVMRTDDGIAVNCYEDLEADFTTPGGQCASLRISGGYPFAGRVKLSLALFRAENWTLMLRIPDWWSAGSFLRVNGCGMKPEPGRYLALKREWRTGDEIEIGFDLSVRAVRSPDITRIAFCSGPLVLAQDSRLSEVDAPVSGAAGGARMPESSLPEGISAAWELADGTRLCCYAEAGNCFSRENPFTVWCPPRHPDLFFHSN